MRRDGLKHICVFSTEFGSCRVGWKDFGQYCYQFNLNKKSWPSAQISCVNQQAELVSIHSPVEQAHISLETGPHGLDSPAWIGKRKISFLQIKSNLVILTIEFEQIVCHSAPFLSYYLISAVLNTGKEYLCQFLRLNYHLRRKNFNFVNLYSLFCLYSVLLLQSSLTVTASFLSGPNPLALNTHRDA